LHDRFDRDQHELLIRQLFSIRQQTTVSNYVKHFTELVDQLSAYSNSTNPVYYTMRFIDGLFPDIKAVVLVQRPKNLDTACVLALLQEEAGASGTIKHGRAGDWNSASKFPLPHKTALPLPLPPRAEKPAVKPGLASSAPATSSTTADPKL